MQRPIRYQAAIMQDDHLLMLKVWDHAFSGKTFWLIPGGGRLPGESEEECVKREVSEETHLEVVVERLLLEEPDIPGGTYERVKTYLCRISQGTPKPGVEPEVDSAEFVTIQEVGWFDLRDSTTWDALALSDPITLSRLRGLQVALGYLDGA
jgi:8-oxo-dGTP pyrophosphatase MutT (NUDIX family)